MFYVCFFCQIFFNVKYKHIFKVFVFPKKGRKKNYAYKLFNTITSTKTGVRWTNMKRIPLSRYATNYFRDIINRKFYFIMCYFYLTTIWLNDKK